MNPSQATARVPAPPRRKAANPLLARRKPQSRSQPASNVSNGAKPSPAQANTQTSSQTPAEEYEDIPIVTTKRALLEGTRYHVLRFLPNQSSSSQTVDVFDQSQFVRPVRLHRRDPRLNHFGQPEDNANNVPTDANGQPIDEKDRLEHERQRAERRAQREEDLKQIAPSGTNPPPKKNKFRKQVEQVFQFSDAAHKKKDMNIRYEEKLPWHVEDFDNKNIWRGTYETALSENHVALVNGPGPAMHMIPIEKWYKFTQKAQFKTLSFEEAENAMKKGARDPLWIARYRQQEQQTRQSEMDRGARRALFARKGERGEQPATTRIKAEGGDDEEKPEISADIDDIDFDYEEQFADDEEGPAIIGEDEKEQVKETEEKVKREQREAAVFDIKDVKDYDAEEQEEKRKAEETKKLSKKVQKALMKREKNYAYEEDSEGNPYSSESESEDSEVERQKEEERKKEEERQQAEESKSGKGGSNKLASGASTGRTNTPTPSNRPSKHPDPMRNMLKRPGSPNLSEASGSESAARKKHKKKHHTGLVNGASISRPQSPANAPSPTSSLKISLDPSRKVSHASGAGSGSDGETSDGARRRLGKARAGLNGSRSGSPTGSRQVSPGAPDAVAGTAQPKKPKAGPPLPNQDYFRSRIPADGIPLTDYIKMDSIRPYRNSPGFTDMIKAVSKPLSKGNLLRPKDA